MPMSRRVVVWFRRAVGRFAAAVVAVGALQAAGCASTPSAAKDERSGIEALTRANAAVVGVDVLAVEGSRSAETLGRVRSGSGVVIGPDHLVLTIGYLLLEADTIQVTTHDNRTLPARLVAYDVATGLGLLRPLLPLRGVAPVPMGSVASLRPGEPLMVATGGDDAAVAMTQVVGTRPFSASWEYFLDRALFTSPPVDNHSGAPVFNRRGELLGIGSLFVGDASGEGRALPGNMFVPIDLLKPILGDLQRTGFSKTSLRPWLGLVSRVSEGRVQVVRVSRGGPAEAGGLQAGDMVLAVDGARVSTLEEFYKAVWARAAPDADVSLTVLRGSEIRIVTLHPVDRMKTWAKPAGI